MRKATMIKPESLATRFSPLDPSFVNDPYPVYAALREHDPVHRSHLGCWVLTRYKDVVDALRDPRLSNEPSPYAVIHRRNRERYTAADVANNILPFMDPPAHTIARGLVNRSFRAHLKGTPPDIQGIADRLLDPLMAKGELDVVNDFGTPLSLAVIAQLLGMPERDGDRLKEWSNWFFYLFSAIPSDEVLDNMNRALDEFRKYVLSLVHERRKVRRDDLISKLLDAREGDARLSEAQLVDTCMLLFADGVENVDSGIGSSLVCLLENPAILARVRDDPELIPSAIEESLRINPPGQFIAKIAKEEIALGDRTIRRNDVVLLVLASANRDAACFENPDEFRLDRPNGQHLGLGKGRHSCLGAPLVRMEMNAALRTLIGRLDGLTVEDSAPEWEARVGHRWLNSLPVSFTPCHGT